MGTALLATDRSLHLTILRVTLGAVMLPHGLQKTIGAFGGYGFEGTMGWFASVGIPSFLGFLVVAAESAGALALIAGFTTRIAAFGIASIMAVAASLFHAPNGMLMNWSGQQKGEGVEYHLLALAMAAVLIIGGGGRFSLDRLITRNR
ncbi:MAG TPA: DoxX family protein [Thermoanaerobaculia bacterium]|nr:DoxX family protein [Thermoanaerobaculia bacterium]